MEKTFYDFGILMLEWTDKNGNTWTAAKEQVDFYGKEVFEQDPLEMDPEEYEEYMEKTKWENAKNYFNL